MRYAADLDENGDVLRVLVVPADTPDGAAYCAALGISGEWRDAPELCAIGQRYHEGQYYSHWRQIAGADTGPEGAEDGWPVGAEVWHSGEIWVSTTSGNVWEPGVSGWRVKGEEGQAPAWEQPTGTHDAYVAGAVVSHNGTTWTNTHGDGNVWEPGVFGWQDEGQVPVNINTADAETLAARLPGVGASLAQAIIDGRPWADPADLAQIGGISEAMVEDWQVSPGLAV